MKKLSAILAALALVATGAASMGCVWFVCDEPKALSKMID